ncbi:hypothetical protein FHS27_004640 [Rhodopirellula rubra]|uniref:Uncharacterized protein n=1 Tax=Aporhodopirellula rubra TaxID=980271 RepID=A0A7W5H6Q2_9BACT|nr:hypothetical protein [Aporhodopirellula rubra]
MSEEDPGNLVIVDESWGAEAVTMTRQNGATCVPLVPPVALTVRVRLLDEVGPFEP